MCLPGTQEIVRASSDKEPARIGRRAALKAGLGAGMAATVAGPALAHAGSGAAPKLPGRMRDLTHVFREGFPVYTPPAPVRRDIKTIEADGFYAQEWTFGEHSGTHMDAPGHFVAGGRHVPQIAPWELIVPVVVIGIRRRAAENPDAVLRLKDILAFEARHGMIPKNAAVFMYSGWETRVGNPDAFLNADSEGTFHFPGFSIKALEWLLEERDITCIGVDTASLDKGESTTFDVHVTLLGADRYGLENLANLNTIPRHGTTAYVGVIPWEEGSGGPCRVIATW